MSGSVHLASPAINKYDRPSLDFVPPRLKIPAGTIEESVIGGGTIDHVTNKKDVERQTTKPIVVTAPQDTWCRMDPKSLQQSEVDGHEGCSQNMLGYLHLASLAINKYDSRSLDFVPPHLKIPAGPIEESMWRDKLQNQLVLWLRRIHGVGWIPNPFNRAKSMGTKGAALKTQYTPTALSPIDTPYLRRMIKINVNIHGPNPPINIPELQGTIMDTTRLQVIMKEVSHLRYILKEAPHLGDIIKEIPHLQGMMEKVPHLQVTMKIATGLLMCHGIECSPPYGDGK
ncbi:hypothetical protein OsI_06600 [Oryza sativa Indica Group]|uniref:Uncharacterized protein n=1 Tax=Oryza sativa subsp. indica TaxID=39946 RepID=B8AF84_ORYSI|nr:hypothetical protein OsI_06600 [Oryza sativa Indica Group]